MVVKIAKLKKSLTKEAGTATSIFFLSTPLPNLGYCYEIPEFLGCSQPLVSALDCLWGFCLFSWWLFLLLLLKMKQSFPIFGSYLFTAVSIYGLLFPKPHCYLVCSQLLLIADLAIITGLGIFFLGYDEAVGVLVCFSSRKWSFSFCYWRKLKVAWRTKTRR